MKLEILLGLVTLMLFPLGGETNIQEYKNVLLHESVSISYTQKTGAIRLITWKFDKNGKRTTILDNTMKPSFIYVSQFKDRLHVSENLFTLTIKDVTMEDSGIYTIDVADINGNTEYYSFNVTVYEPIPGPSIVRTKVEETTTDQCNITLHCSVSSNTSDLSYTWKKRQRNSEYHMYNNGRTIQISLKNDSRDMEFLCIVHNPADQKNVSVQVQDICMFTGKLSASRSYFLTIAVILIIIVILAIVSVIFIWRPCEKRTEERESRDSGSARSPETHYIQVTTERPGDSQGVRMETKNFTGTPFAHKTKAETVYITLQHPQPEYT